MSSQSNLADFLPPEALGIKLETWKNYRQKILKVSQEDLSDLLGLRGSLLISLERGQLEYFASPVEFSDLIRQLCIHAQETKEDLFPELSEYWNYFPEFSSNIEDLQHNKSQEADARLDKTQLYELVRKVLATLSPIEEKVLRMRFGIGEKSDQTLEEVAQDFYVTQDRIRQIEIKALRKLRHPSRSIKLVDFSDLTTEDIHELKSLIIMNSNWYNDRNS